MKQHQQKITIQLIVDSLRDELPGGFAHTNMLPEGRSLIVSDDNLITRQSAVLILLFEKDGEIHFCLTQRNSNLKHHPGQISFPGGSCEIDEVDASDTALRETEEEIGIQRNEIELLGKLSDLYVQVSNFCIHPYIGYMAQTPVFNINKHEVEKMITVPISEILIKENHRSMMVETSIGILCVPCYQLKEHLVWGATAMIIAELEALLMKHL